MNELRNDEWLDAIHNHAATTDTELHVAVSMLLTGSANEATKPCSECGHREPIAQQFIDESVTVLTELGFVESVAAVDCSDCEGCCESHLLVLRMPAVV
jgi:hypothetical protein